MNINIDIVHDTINVILFIVLLNFIYCYNMECKNIEHMDMTMFASDSNYSSVTNSKKLNEDTITIGLKNKLEKLEQDLINQRTVTRDYIMMDHLKRDYLKNRDLAVIYDPLTAPEGRIEYEEYVFPNNKFNIKTRGEPDDYIMVGLLYNKEINKNYQLYGRRIYPGAYEWEYYILGRDISGLEFKFPHHHYNKQEILDGEIIKVPVDDYLYHVKIYKFDQPRYNPYPLF